MNHNKIFRYILIIFSLSASHSIFADEPVITNYTCPDLEGGVLQNEILEDRWRVHLSYGNVSKISGPPWIEVNIVCEEKTRSCKLECIFAINKSNNGSIAKVVSATSCVVSDSKLLGEFSCSQ